MVVHQLRNIGSFVPMILPLVKNLIQNPEIRQFGIYLLSYKWLKMFHINFKQIFKGEYFKAILEVYIFKGFIVSSFCHHLIIPVSWIHITFWSLKKRN